MIRLRKISLLRQDSRGAALVEFAFVAPIMLMVIMGLGDLTYQVYAQALLDGTLQKAGRDSTIQGAALSTEDIDTIVKNSVRRVAGKATFTSSRKSYSSFSNIKPEKFTDTNGNGVRDPKECFEDVNGNKVWDADPGSAGQGGASDVTLYSITVTYPRLFPVASLLGFPATQTLSSQTILKNQPYSSQVVSVPATICT
jgi:Flp pilus assembly protein TadG